MTTTEMTSTGEAGIVTPHFTAVDYVLFVLMLMASVGIGLVTAFRNSHNVSPQEYLLGSRKMSPIAVALSMLGGWVSALSILGEYSQQLM